MIRLNQTDEELPPVVLNDKQYDVLKWVVGIVIPAVGTLYFGVAKIWNLPAGEQVLGTLLVIQTFLGVILGISTKVYKSSDARFDGDINIVHQADGEKRAAIVFNEHPKELAHKKEAIFKVNAP
jgi:hypothetical protein